MASPDADQWKQAMDEEMASLLANQTWTLERTPTGIRTIPAKWVFKIKRDADGGIERYKARLVAKGFLQREGVDFTEVFAPVSKHTSLRALLAIVNADNLHLKQLDVKTAFLNGELDEVIYMSQPPGYHEGGPDISCHLHKALYGLRQAPRAWHHRLKSELEKLGMTESSADPGLYIMTGPTTIFLLVYVDDILIAGSDVQLVNAVVNQLGATFDLRDLGEPKMFLGMEIHRDTTAGILKLSQTRMTEELVKKYNLSEARTRSTPFNTSVKLTKEGTLLDTTKYGYAELVGSLLYLSVCTRPDIAQAVGALARYMSKPTQDHWKLAKGVLRYLATTTNYGIIFTKTELDLRGYCDADFAGDLDTRRSTTGYVFLLSGAAISWSSRLQSTVAASTTEAEYMAAASAVKEGLWLRKLMLDFKKPVTTLVIMCDNQAAITLLKNHISSTRTKHIDVMYHFAREHVARKEIAFTYISTQHMVADCLTKPLPPTKLEECCSAMGLGV
jgi:hypothetical protein